MKLLLTFILLTGVCFGQSKNEQINKLTTQVESLLDSIQILSFKLNLSESEKKLLETELFYKSKNLNLAQVNLKQQTEKYDRISDSLNKMFLKSEEIELKLDSLQRQKMFYLNWNISTIEIENALLFRNHIDDLTKSYKSNLNGMGIFSMNDLLSKAFSNKIEYGFNITYGHLGEKTSCADCGYINILFNNDSGRNLIEISYGERAGYDIYSINTSDFSTLSLTLSNLADNSTKYLKFITPDIIKFDNNFYPTFDPPRRWK